MRVGTITSNRSDELQDVPIVGFADEPDVARLIAAHTVFGGPFGFELHVISQPTPRAPEGEPAVAFDCHIGETTFSRYFTLVGNESVVDEMIQQRVLVLMPAPQTCQDRRWRDCRSCSTMRTLRTCRASMAKVPEVQDDA